MAYQSTGCSLHRSTISPIFGVTRQAPSDRIPRLPFPVAPALPVLQPGRDIPSIAFQGPRLIEPANGRVLSKTSPGVRPLSFLDIATGVGTMTHGRQISPSFHAAYKKATLVSLPSQIILLSHASPIQRLLQSRRILPVHHPPGIEDYLLAGPKVPPPW